MTIANATTLPLAGFTPQHFALAVRGKVATVTLNRPEKKNPLTFASYRELTDFFLAAQQEEAVKAGYGPTVRADAVKKLVDSVVNFQEKSRTIINEMRVASTKNSAEIRDAVEDGKRRLATLAAEGNALLLETKN